MNDTLLTAITDRTFSRSDLAYRTSLLKEFFEYVFYKRHEARAKKDDIAAFAKEAKKSDDDAHFLESLPEAFIEAFSQDTFYDMLKKLSEDTNKMRTLGLTVPVYLTRLDVEALGAWARANIGPDTMLEIDVDDSIAVGCQVVWNDVLHDFSLSYFLTKNADAVHSDLLKRTTRAQ